jgi:hypothetical protein
MNRQRLSLIARLLFALLLFGVFLVFLRACFSPPPLPPPPPGDAPPPSRLLPTPYPPPPATP